MSIPLDNLPSEMVSIIFKYVLHLGNLKNLTPYIVRQAGKCLTLSKRCSAVISDILDKHALILDVWAKAALPLYQEMMPILKNVTLDESAEGMPYKSFISAFFNIKPDEEGTCAIGLPTKRRKLEKGPSKN